MKILLVEDSDDYRKVFGLMLRNEPGLEIVYAETLGQAFELLAKESFDCVVCDPGLPDSLPAMTVRVLLDRNPSANVIAISGSTDPETMAAAVKAGAHSYLIKGKNDLRAEDLMRVIKDGITRKKVSACG